ncbi:MAG TPA: NADH-ubiquinone oxidoreductase-F iron-sulfur binding region domain-containing protein [Anaerolineales bacterium]|nr:NADH-ubiquinone oxidoreductase-F iron-sulfur binding region domain-containing protein [Anaerolineales bacterium]
MTQSMDREALDRQLVEEWADKPAPLLGVLHAFHDRDGHISEAALRAISKGLRQPLADLFGTVTFYHHMSREAEGLNKPRVCTGPVCSLQGGNECLSALADKGATPMPCAGRCDEPVPVLIGHEQFVGDAEGNLKRAPTLLPPANPGGVEECVFAKIREPERNTLAGYQRTGGYEGLMLAVKEMAPEGVIEHVKASKLAGRGGAAFPTGQKWDAVAKASGTPKSIVCNADEGEPGCFKDRAIMDYDPFAMIEGMTLAAYATGATRGFIYLRYEYPETAFVLEKAIADAYSANLLGKNILGANFDFDLYVRRGGGAYICGEEGSLLNSLEGKHPFPRNRPPFPVTHGFENLPTAVNNVETLAAVAQIMRHEPEWYVNLGVNGQPGTKVVSLSGDIQRPGNYEVPFGLPLRTLIYDWAGGPRPGRAIQAVTMAGLSGGFLSHDDIESATVDEPSIRSKGSMLGAAGMIVYDDSRDMVEAAHNAMEFFAHESCGKCFPCRIGTQRLVERLNGDGPGDMNIWLDEVKDLNETMKSVSACGLGMAAPLVVESLIKHFPEQVKAHVETR